MAIIISIQTLQMFIKLYIYTSNRFTSYGNSLCTDSFQIPKNIITIQRKQRLSEFRVKRSNCDKYSKENTSFNGLLSIYSSISNQLLR